MADAGYRLTVDGEAEFKRALADINAQIKLNKSELNALTAEYNANGGSLDTLKQKQAALGTEMANQQQKVDLMRQRLEEAKAAYGENSAQVVKLQTDLNNAAGALATMQKQYNDTARQIEDATHSTADFDEAVKQADAAIAAEKAELANISAAYQDAGGKTGALADSTKALGDSAKTAEERSKALEAQQKNLTAQVEAQQKKVEALSGAMKTSADRFGENSTEANKYREQLAKAEGELGKTKDALDKTTKAMEDQSGASGGLMDGLKGLADQFGIQLPAGMDKMMEGFGNLLGPAGIAGLLTGIAEAAKTLDEMGDKAVELAATLMDLSDKTGANTKQLQGLHYVCQILGVDTNAVDKAMENLSKKMYEAKTKGGDAQKMFDDLGVSLVDNEGNMRSTTDVLLDVIDGLKQYELGAERTAAADKLLGGAAQQLTSLLAQNGDNIRSYMAEYTASVGYMTDALTDYLNRLDKEQQRLKTLRQNLNNLTGVGWKAFWSGDRQLSDMADEQFWKAFGSYYSELFRYIKGAYARGTSYHPGGLALVGEQGPEIVDLPQGSKVYPTGTGPSGGTTNNWYVTIDASRIREFEDIVRIAENERVSRRMGVAR